MFLTKMWFFIKKYWKIVAFIVAAIVGIVLFKGQISSFVDDYKKIKEVHDEELKTIEEAHASERKRKAQVAEKLEKTLKVIEKEYETKNDALDRKKKKDIKKIVNEMADDPEKLADELSKVTGWKVILPED